MKCKVKPKVSSVELKNLGCGQCFQFEWDTDGDVYMLTDCGKIGCVRLTGKTGNYFEFLSEEVIPVTCELEIVS